MMECSVPIAVVVAQIYTCVKIHETTPKTNRLAAGITVQEMSKEKQLDMGSVSSPDDLKDVCTSVLRTPFLYIGTKLTKVNFTIC